MTKNDLISQLSAKAGLSKKEAKIALDTTFELIISGVKKSGKVGITGFGTFMARKQKATDRVNPQSGQKMRIPSKTVPKFKPGKQFKEAVAK